MRNGTTRRITVGSTWSRVTFRRTREAGIFRPHIEADELDIRKDNVEEVAAESDDPRVQRFLGVTPGLGKALGLDEKWAVNVIKSVGNYGELYDRHLGEQSPMQLPRGANDIWTRGGLLYSRAFR